MNVLYLTYGNHSGVVNRLAEFLPARGIHVKTKNLAKRLNYRYTGIKFPRISLSTLINVYLARKQFGNDWKRAYLRTDFAFNAMSKSATRLILTETKYDAILQSGVLFAPRIELVPKPFFLGILDNTYLIGKYGRRRPKGIQLSDHFVHLETHIYKIAHKIFVASNHVKLSLIEDYSIDPNKVIVVGMGPNIEPVASFTPLENKYRSAKIVMIALDFRRKGGDDVLIAFDRVKRIIPKCRLVVIGSKSETSIDGVTFRGILNRNEIRKELEDANIFVMPSYKEPFGIALIEAMAFHTPCIASDIEAMPEMIEQGKTGFLIKPGDIDQLSNKIELVLNSPSLAKAMGCQGYKKYIYHYTWDIIANKICHHLKTSLNHYNGL